jgi:hypothetical protein
MKKECWPVFLSSLSTVGRRIRSRNTGRAAVQYRRLAESLEDRTLPAPITGGITLTAESTAGVVGVPGSRSGNIALSGLTLPTGGVLVAVGYLNSDRFDDIICGAGPAAGRSSRCSTAPATAQ